MEHKLVRKTKGSPDETRRFSDGKGKMEIFLHPAKACTPDFGIVLHHQGGAS
jgi:hypothetical protein